MSHNAIIYGDDERFGIQLLNIGVVERILDTFNGETITMLVTAGDEGKSFGTDFE